MAMGRLQFGRLCLLTVACVFLGCGGSGDAAGGKAAAPKTANAPIKVTCTTGMVGDLVASIGGERVDVTTLMGPGVDPHLYQATAGDIASLQGADMIFYSGLPSKGRWPNSSSRWRDATPSSSRSRRTRIVNGS